MKRYFIILTPLLISAGCVLSYNVIGSKVAEDSTLIEPFFLIPIAWLSFIIAIVSSLILGVPYLLKKK